MGCRGSRAAAGSPCSVRFVEQPRYRGPLSGTKPTTPMIAGRRSPGGSERRIRARRRFSIAPLKAGTGIERTQRSRTERARRRFSIAPPKAGTGTERARWELLRYPTARACSRRHPWVVVSGTRGVRSVSGCVVPKGDFRSHCQQNGAIGKPYSAILRLAGMIHPQNLAYMWTRGPTGAGGSGSPPLPSPRGRHGRSPVAQRCAQPWTAAASPSARRSLWTSPMKPAAAAAWMYDTASGGCCRRSASYAWRLRRVSLPTAAALAIAASARRMLGGRGYGRLPGPPRS
jgi:hypothetical protein